MTTFSVRDDAAALTRRLAAGAPRDAGRLKPEEFLPRIREPLLHAGGSEPELLAAIVRKRAQDGAARTS